MSEVGITSALLFSLFFSLSFLNILSHELKKKYYLYHALNLLSSNDYTWGHWRGGRGASGKGLNGYGGVLGLPHDLDVIVILGCGDDEI